MLLMWRNLFIFKEARKIKILFDCNTNIKKCKIITRCKQSNWRLQQVEHGKLAVRLSGSSTYLFHLPHKHLFSLYLAVSEIKLAQRKTCRYKKQGKQSFHTRIRHAKKKIWIEKKLSLTSWFNTWACERIDGKQTSRVTSYVSMELLISLEACLITPEQTGVRLRLVDCLLIWE